VVLASLLALLMSAAADACRRSVLHMMGREAPGEAGVTFRRKDCRAEGRTRYKTMTPGTDESMRRFLLHAARRLSPDPPLRAHRQRIPPVPAHVLHPVSLTLPDALFRIDAPAFTIVKVREAAARRLSFD